MNILLAILAGTAIASPFKPGRFDAVDGYTCNQTQISNLWNASGQFLTHAVYLTSVDYVLGYHTTQTASTTTYQKQSANSMWACTLTFHFSNSSWTSYEDAMDPDNDGAVWVQVANYIQTVSSGSVSFSSPLDYFQNPNHSPLLWYSSMTYQTDNNFHDVNPKMFLLRQMTVDPYDNTKGSITWSWSSDNAAPGGPFDNGPATTTVTTTGSSPETFLGVLWVFARDESTGDSSITTPYRGYSVEAG